MATTNLDPFEKDSERSKPEKGERSEKSKPERERKERKTTIGRIVGERQRKGSQEPELRERTFGMDNLVMVCNRSIGREID